MKHGTKPKFKYKRVKIIWQDIVNDPSWYDSLEDVDKTELILGVKIPATCFLKIIRWLRYLHHILMMVINLTVGNITVFPRSVVKKIEVLK